MKACCTSAASATAQAEVTRPQCRREWQCSPQELLAAAGLDPQQHPVSILSAILIRQEVLEPTEAARLQTSPDAALLWKKAAWNLKEHTAAALKLAKLRRADAITAKLEALSAQVDQLPVASFTTEEHAAFRQEVCQLYTSKFCATNELKTIDCFEKETAGTAGFEDIDPQENPWLRVNALGKKPEDMALKEQQQAALDLSYHFSDLNVTVQDKLSFCQGAMIGRVVNRLRPEKKEDQAEHKEAHMQMQICLKLASRDKRFGADVKGYLVEHFRTGQVSALQLQVRDTPFEPVTAVSKKATAMNAGTMIVTQHSLRKAEAFWDRELQSSLRKFSQIARQLVQSKERRQAFVASEDKAAWFDAQTSLVRS